MQNSELHTTERLELLIQKIGELHHQSGDFEKVEKQLVQFSDDPDLNSAALKQFKKEFYERKRKEGLAKIGIGMFFILSGFVITCTNFHTNSSVNFAMYGLTSFGLCIVFWGLYKIIG